VARKSKKARSSAHSRSKTRKVPHNSKRPSPKSSAQLAMRSRGSKSPLTGPEKKRGPKPNIRPSEVVNRAYDLRLTFNIAGKQLDWSKVLAAQSQEEIVATFAQMDESYRRKFLYNPELFLMCLKDSKFPKQDRKAQEEFIADSLAGDGRISIRRSRDICGEDRTKRKRQGKILRREFYVVCSCGYTGPALHNACPDCGAIVSYLDFATGFTLGGYS
jgi:hypothetical protein